MTGPSASDDPITPLVRSLLGEVGEDPDRPGLVQTPSRVARSLRFLLSGYGLNLKEFVNGAIFEEPYSEMVVVRDIEVYSLCEHHLLPFFGKAHVAYVPDGRILGLSKIPRIVDMFARRLQVQERLTTEIADALQAVLEPAGGRRRHRGNPPLHGDARRREAEQLGGDLVADRLFPRRRQVAQ